MLEIRSNEREFNSQVITWLNEFISGGSYPFDNVTGETSVKVAGETTKFPDVQVWLNRTFDHRQAETLSRRIFQELGLPTNSL